MVECLCGYLATDEIALDDHIAYVTCVVGDDDEHRERK